jgi:hypothetical protein
MTITARERALIESSETIRCNLSGKKAVDICSIRRWQKIGT